MTFKQYIYVALRIVLVFTIAIMATFIPEHLRDFFGDKPETDGYSHMFDEEWDWGIRHYWYFWMMIMLLIWSVIYTITSSIQFFKDTKQ